VIIATYISQPRWQHVFQNEQKRPINSVWFSAFQVVSAYTNTGMSLVDQSMVPFNDAIVMIIVLIFLILAGNTAFVRRSRSSFLHFWLVNSTADPVSSCILSRLFAIFTSSRGIACAMECTSIYVTSLRGLTSCPAGALQKSSGGILVSMRPFISFWTILAVALCISFLHTRLGFFLPLSWHSRKLSELQCVSNWLYSHRLVN